MSLGLECYTYHPMSRHKLPAGTAKNTLTAIRFSAETLARIEKAIEKMRAPSKSHVIHKAVEEFLMKQGV